jgi:protease I
MELEGNRIAVLVEDHYADLELWYPALRLQEAGAEVTVVGAEVRRYTSQYGLPIRADIRAEEASADDFNALIIPGSAAPDARRSDPAITRFIHDMEQRGKVVAAISYADRDSTAAPEAEREEHTAQFFGLKARVQQEEGAFAESTILREGNIITACPPVDLLSFCRMIMVALMAANTKPSAHLKNYG